MDTVISRKRKRGCCSWNFMPFDRLLLRNFLATEPEERRGSYVKNMMNRPLKIFLAGHDRICEKYELADEKAYASFVNPLPPNAPRKKICYSFFIVSASPGRFFGYSRDKPGESTGKLCYVPCKASNRDNKVNVCPFKRIAFTDRSQGYGPAQSLRRKLNFPCNHEMDEH